MISQLIEVIWPTTAFWWRRTLAGNAQRVVTLGIQITFLFQANLKPPIVKEVVFINKTFFFAKLEISQRHFCGRLRIIWAVASRHAHGFAMNIELVKEIITPVAGYLNGVMEVSKSVIGTKQQTAPNDGLNADEPETELIAGYGLLLSCSGHLLIMVGYLDKANLSTQHTV